MKIRATLAAVMDSAGLFDTEGGRLKAAIHHKLDLPGDTGFIEMSVIPQWLPDLTRNSRELRAAMTEVSSAMREAQTALGSSDWTGLQHCGLRMANASALIHANLTSDS